MVIFYFIYMLILFCLVTRNAKLRDPRLSVLKENDKPVMEIDVYDFLFIFYTIFYI